MKLKVTIIIPALNEEEEISSTLESIYNQLDQNGNKMRNSSFQLIIVDNGSEDNTKQVIEEYCKFRKVKNLKVIVRKEKGFVQAKKFGVEFLIKSKTIKSTDVVAFIDSDVRVPNNWLNRIISEFEYERDLDAISFAGTFPNSFWSKVPRLADKYCKEVGTIFFDLKTAKKYSRNRKLFSPTLFLDFGRPVSGGCWAIKTETYLKNGGYQVEFYGKSKKKQVDGPSWRLMFKVQRGGGKIKYIDDVYFEASPRRLVNDPLGFFKIKKYNELDKLKHFRGESVSAFTLVNKIAKKIDLSGVIRYVIEYYIFLQTVINPILVLKNESYFGSLSIPIYSEIQSFWKESSNRSGNEIFEFNKSLTEKYYSVILSQLKLKV